MEGSKSPAFNFLLKGERIRRRAMIISNPKVFRVTLLIRVKCAHPLKMWTYLVIKNVDIV